MCRSILAFFILLLYLSVPPISAQKADYTMLDPNPYNPKTDPNIDMFIGNWRESLPHHIWGTLIERDILKKNDGDPLRPKARGAALQYINRLSYGLLSARNVTTPAVLKGEQVIFYIDGGKGEISAGGKTVKLYNGVCVLMPPEIEFTLKNSGEDPLTMYLMVEPVPADFKPKTEMVAKDENILPFDMADAHWTYIPKFFFSKKDGLATIDGMAPVWHDPMTMGQPHSHCPGMEEVWFSLEGDPTILLGKQLRPFPAGSAYKIPPDYRTPHSAINVKNRPVKTFWFIVRTVPEPPPPSYSMLDARPFDPKRDADIDLYMSNWKNSMPRNTHGSLVERDVLTKGDPMKPSGKGGALKYVNRFTYATLYAHNVTIPTTLKGEQEVFYILSGEGKITAGKKSADLHKGISVLMPANLEFTMLNTGAEPLTMYLVSEPIPAGFRPNKDMLVVDENTAPITTSDAHWVGAVKQFFTTKDGLGTMESILTCYFSPNTFFHPHSHVPGTEEVWLALDPDTHVLFGKQIRLQEPGTAYMIPPDGKTPHANFNLSDKTVKLFYFARYQDHEVRK
ncbi:MAG: cupin domain-containing protein [Candidatus Latescibacter sp.]|nr:cupin domain-containing protein [Candidatus Latescibacter sp.]